MIIYAIMHDHPAFTCVYDFPAQAHLRNICPSIVCKTLLSGYIYICKMVGLCVGGGCLENIGQGLEMTQNDMFWDSGVSLVCRVELSSQSILTLFSIR